MRLKVRLCASTTIAALLVAASAVAQTVRFNVPSEAAAKSIPEFARQAGIQITAPVSGLHNVVTPAIIGNQDVRAALAKLVAGTGLEIVSDDGQTIVLRVKQKTSDGSYDAGKLETVMVTAERREEALEKTPVPVTAVDTERLADNDVTLLRDYYMNVPGLNLAPGIVTSQVLSIRGLPVGGITIDDVPFGATTGFLGSIYPPDIDPGDLARIEVLRGPQGTLYGASSEGGLVKFVTVEPSMDNYAARVQFGASSVYNGAEPGYFFRASANIPLTDDLAVRVSGFQRQDPGYVDSSFLGISGINKTLAYGGRAALLWQPSDSMSLKLTALVQDLDQQGSSDVIPGFGDLQQNYIRGAGRNLRTAQNYSATFNAKFWNIQLTAITGYNIVWHHTVTDFTFGFGPGAPPPNSLSAFGVDGSVYDEIHADRNLSQEVRLLIPIWDRLELLVGGYYTYQHDPLFFEFPAVDTVTGRYAGNLLGGLDTNSFEEYAAFADLTYHITDDLDVQIGARENFDRLVLVEYNTGVLNGPQPFFGPTLFSNDNAFTYLLTPRYQINPDLMVYARFASGYAPGGPNSGLPGVPLTFGPEKSEDYEIGTKDELFDHSLYVDASLYYIAYKHVQIGLNATGTNLAYTANAGTAKSEGVEVSVDAHPIEGLDVSSWISYDDAVLTSPFPANSTAIGRVGDWLPSVARWSGHLSVNHEFRLFDDVTGFAGGAVSYYGRTFSSFSTTPHRDVFPDYTKLDLRMGVRSGSWTVNLYANNATDRRALIGGLSAYDPPNALVFLTPRTIGFSVVKTY